MFKPARNKVFLRKQGPKQVGSIELLSGKPRFIVTAVGPTDHDAPPIGAEVELALMPNPIKLGDEEGFIVPVEQIIGYYTENE